MPRKQANPQKSRASSAPPAPPPRRITAPVAAAVRLACARPWLTLAISLVLAAVALVFTVTHFDMTSDTAKLISPKADWRKHEQALDAAFPQGGDTTVVVIDGATPELAEKAAADLTAALEPQTKLFLGVRRPDGGPFFAREGLLFLSTNEVRET